MGQHAFPYSAIKLVPATTFLGNPSGSIGDVQAMSAAAVISALGLAGSYQALDSDLTAIAGLSPTNNDILQRKSGAWTNRTMAQLYSDLGLGTIATQSAASVAITGGTITGLSSPTNPSDAATKSYVDNAVTGLLDFKGSTDASSNPNFPAASKGDAYVISVAGKIGGASGTIVDAGDVAFANADNAGGTLASVGTSWTILEHNLVGAALTANNLSDLASASSARTNLGLAIGTNVQAYSAELDAVAAIVPANDDIIQRKGGVWTHRTIAQYLSDLNLGVLFQPLDSDLTAIAALTTTTYGRSLLTQADAAALRSTAGLGSLATQSASSVAITGGTITGLSAPSAGSDAATKTYVDTAVTGLLDFKGGTDCSTNPNYPAALKGDSYVVTVDGKIGGASGTAVFAGDVFFAIENASSGNQATVGASWAIVRHSTSGGSGDMLSSNNLSDVANVATARDNLGLTIGTDVQAYAATLDDITALTPTNDDILQYKGGVWTNRTVSQYLSDLGIAAAYQPLDADLTAIAALSATNDDIIQRKAGAWTNRTMAQLATDLGLAAGYQPLDSDLTAIAALSTTSFGRSVLTQADAAALRTLAGLGTIATQNADAVNITGGTITGLSTPSGSTDAATKGYVDTAVTGLLDFKGSTDTSSNPNYPAGSKGDTYVVSVAGKVGGASGKSVEVGDMYLATADNAGGDEATVGTSWVVLEHNLVGAVLASNNLSDLANAGTARTNLGLAIGTNVQAYNANLAAIAALSPSNDDILQRKAGAWTNRTIAQLATDLGLAAGYQPLDSDLTAIAALTTTTFGRALLTQADAAAVISTLSLGTAALKNTSTSGNNVPLLDGANTWSSAQTLSAASTIVASTHSITNNAYSYKVFGGSGTIECANSNNATAHTVQSNTQNQATSGPHHDWRHLVTWAPSTGSVEFRNTVRLPVINMTGTSSGGYVIDYMDVTETAILGTPTRLLCQWKVGGSEKWKIDNTGAATLATSLTIGSVVLNSTTLTGLSSPSNSSDAATKAYVDTAVTGLLEFKGSTDCSANPNYPAASKGDTYVVTVAGKIGGASGKSVDIGDMYLCTADAASGAEAAVGTSWSVLEHNLVGALIASNNLSDISSASTARTNLGLAIGTNVQAYSAELAGLAALSSTGVVARTASGTYAARTITGTTNVITVTNGDGVSGNPTLTVGSLVQRTDTAAVLTAQQNFGSVALTSTSAHIAWNLATAQMAKHTFTENTTLDNPSNMVDGGTYTIKFTQHASSPKTLAWGSAYKWAAGSAPTISATNSAVDIVTFVSDGTNMYGTMIKAFA